MFQDKIPVGKAENLIGKKFDKLTVLYRTHNEGKRPAWMCQCECGKKVVKRADVLKTQKQLACSDCMVGNNRLNLIGQKFGYLTVIEEDGQDARLRLKWKCKCDCGKIVTVLSSSLIQGNTKSCGCFVKEKMREIHLKNIAGQKFGYLTALEIDEKLSDERGRIYWKCKCDCGNTISIQSSHLVNNKTHSCGCLTASFGETAIKNILKENNIIFEEQKTFPNCRFADTNWLARFDFYVNNEFLIEFDGSQHFFFIEKSKWNTEENLIKTQKRDAYKNQWCKENNIPLIRIPYTKLDTLCIEDLMLETTKFRVV